MRAALGALLAGALACGAPASGATRIDGDTGTSGEASDDGGATIRIDAGPHDARVSVDASAPSDAGALTDAAPGDAGDRLDAGPRDASAFIDAGTHTDGGRSTDAGTTNDAGALVDARIPIDGGRSTDAGLRDVGASIDAGTTNDASTTDAGFFIDAGTAADASTTDAGATLDAGTTNDAGPPDTGTPIDSGTTRDSGSSIDSGTTADAGPSLDAGTADSGALADAGASPDSGVPATPMPPVYSGGTCPTLVAGHNAFVSGGASRDVLLQLPANPDGAAVVFAWRWLTGTQQQALDWTGLTSGVGADAVILVSPETQPNTDEWEVGGTTATNEDLVLFDDLLACLFDQFAVDMDRVAIHGHSSGATWVSFLLQQRAQYLAVASVLSGGQMGAFTTPVTPIPVLLISGGPTDMAGGFDFFTATATLRANLRSAGHFVVYCEGTFGHSIPPNPSFTYTFLADHPRTAVPSPYANGLPSTMPAWCSIVP